jgi:hypothetical protein
MKSRRPLLALLAASLGVASLLCIAARGSFGAVVPGAARSAAPGIIQTSSPNDLTPGGPAEALSGTFTNPNASPVRFTSVTAVVRSFSARSNLAEPACTAADYTISGSSGPYVDVITGSRWSGLAIALKAEPVNQDNCKGVSIAIAYSATA